MAAPKADINPVFLEISDELILVTLSCTRTYFMCPQAVSRIYPAKHYRVADKTVESSLNSQQLASSCSEHVIRHA
ncbi:hypothetical protein DNY36_18910 [Salmonella enterica subsp. diarizonae]|nr:hypothetical protein [Salmonella enterica subsp. diarizonae]ECI3627938.1 hypothetical protein [Salmonella enterica subsp. diarizonae]